MEYNSKGKILTGSRLIIVISQFKYKGEWYIENNDIYLIWELCKHESRLRINERKLEKLETDYKELETNYNFIKTELEKTLELQFNIF